MSKLPDFDFVLLYYMYTFIYTTSILNKPIIQTVSYNCSDKDLFLILINPHNLGFTSTIID